MRSFSRFPRWVLLALLYSAPVAAQDPGQRLPGASSPAPGRGLTVTVDGRVVRAGDGTNVAGARVILTDNRGAIRGVVYTRDGGSFQFPQVNPGRYSLTVWHQDYAEYTETLDLMLSPVTGLQIMLVPRALPPETLQSTVPVWALQIPRKAEQEFDRGLQAMERGDTKRALRFMQKAVQVYPDFATAHAALGNAYQKLTQPENAKKAYEKAVAIDDTLYSAWLGLGTLALAAHRHAEAEQHLRRACSLRPGHWPAWYQLAELYAETGDAPHTEESVRHAWEMHASMPRLHILLINALVMQEKYLESLATMEAFLAAFPDDPLAREVARKHDLLRAELSRVAP